MRALSRRDFMKLAGQGFLAASGILGLGIMVRFLGFQSEPPQPSEYDLGLASDYPVGSRTNLPDIPAVLVHLESGFTAMSLTCTHLGCALEPEADIYACPCHGSQFDKNGAVLHGPATKGLTVLRVEVNDTGHVILFV
jgi:cytochrome b6-f complex iron-sulfur subunit